MFLNSKHVEKEFSPDSDLCNNTSWLKEIDFARPYADKGKRVLNILDMDFIRQSILIFHLILPS